MDLAVLTHTHSLLMAPHGTPELASIRTRSALLALDLEQVCDLI